MLRKRLFQVSWRYACLFCLAVFVCLVFVAGCSISPETQSPAVPTASATPDSPPQAIVPAATPVGAEISPAGMVLKLWLPQQFDINQDNPAALILRQRLAEFVAQNPGVTLDVRIKADIGPGGMMDSFSTASAAAPLALPDLVALPRSILEQAALKGYLRQLEGLVLAIHDPDWYEYALQMSSVQKSTFGLPFAGDALVMVYQPGTISQPPQDWAQTLSISATMTFPASDTMALFTQAQYLAAGGQLQDDQGRPALDEQILANVFRFYHQASLAGRMPFWLTQYETDQQSWEAWQANPSGLTVTWVSRVLQNHGDNLQAVPIPTISGPTYTLSTAWVWALVSPSRDAQRDSITLRLVEFLCEPDFLGRWTKAAGYLPTRSTAFAAWDADPHREMVAGILSTTYPMPPANILAVLGPGLRQAVNSVLRQQIDPDQAAQTVLEVLNPP